MTPTIRDIEEVYQEWILADPKGEYSLSAFELFRYLKFNFSGLIEKDEDE